MRPVPTPEQEQLRLAVREFCAGEIDVPRLRSWEESAWGVDDRHPHSRARRTWTFVTFAAAPAAFPRFLDVDRRRFEFLRRCSAIRAACLGSLRMGGEWAGRPEQTHTNKESINENENETNKRNRCIGYTERSNEQIRTDHSFS